MHAGGRGGEGSEPLSFQAPAGTKSLGPGGRASNADLWAASKALREQDKREQERAQKETQKKTPVGQPVFFKGNKGSSAVKKEQDDDAGAKRSGIKKRDDSDLQYASITEEQRRV